MIDINLLPPNLRPAGGGALVKAVVVLLLLALVPLGAAVAEYVYSVLPALERERAGLAAAYETEHRLSDPLRREAAGGLLRGRAAWTRALADVKTAVNAAAGRDGTRELWLERFDGAGTGFDLTCRTRADAALSPGAVVSGFPRESPVGGVRPGETVWDDGASAWRFTLSGTIGRNE